MPRQFSKTRARHRKLGALFRPGSGRAPGHRPRPLLVRFDPEPGVPPSAEPPVRIFIGSEPAQFRAERVLLWSIAQLRDKARAYEIQLLKDLEGFERRRWKTGFTHYRYAVPQLAGGRGRALYNDVDQIYLADPAELFDLDMEGAGVLSVDDRETSVMLLDCAKMAEVWKLEGARRIHKHKHYRRLAQDAGLWGPMPAEWNARDGEFAPGRSKLLHFTTLQTQPWQPFPDAIRYRPHPQARVWLEKERAADAAGFTVWTAERPSERQRELLELYRKMHGAEPPKQGKGSRGWFRGRALGRHVERIAELVRRTGARTILDYGSGKAGLYRDDPEHPPGSRHKRMDGWGAVAVTCYDPGYEPYAAALEGSFDGVISTDVLEHIPEEDVPWVLEELFGRARHFVYAVATCYPAKKRLPDGQNAHCTVLPPGWWRGQMEQAARRHPGVEWCLCTKQRSFLALRKRKGLLRPGVAVRYHTGRGDAPR